MQEMAFNHSGNCLQVFDAIAKWKLQSDITSLPGAGAGLVGPDDGFGM